jgi:hypothetical protein
MWINELEDWSLHMHEQKQINMSIKTDFVTYEVIAPKNERNKAACPLYLAAYYVNIDLEFHPTYTTLQGI